MCWQAARDQAVVGDHARWIDSQTIDAVAGERGDDVQSAAEFDVTLSDESSGKKFMRSCRTTR